MTAPDRAGHAAELLRDGGFGDILTVWNEAPGLFEKARRSIQDHDTSDAWIVTRQ